MKTENDTKPLTYTCTQVLDKKVQELEIKIKNMNYVLLLEYTHSKEYNKMNITNGTNYFFKNSNRENSYHEEAL